MGWIDAERVLISIGAMMSPTTLTFLRPGARPRRSPASHRVVVLPRRPGATLAVGVVAAFVLGDAAASRDSTPKTWVAVFDVVAACLLLVYVAKTRNRPLEQAKVDGMVARMGKVASSPAVAVVAAGAVLANPGAFIPLALKSISETDPSTAGYVVEWVFFSLVSLLPLAVALLLLLVARDWAERLLMRVRDLLIARARTVASVIVFILALALLRNGIAGLV